MPTTETQKPASKSPGKVAQRNAEPKVVVVRQQDTPPDNYPFSQETVVKQYSEYLNHMASKGYYLGAILPVAVGAQMENYLIFNQY
jgi:hypothetical protein